MRDSTMRINASEQARYKSGKPAECVDEINRYVMGLNLIFPFFIPIKTNLKKDTREFPQQP